MNLRGKFSCRKSKIEGSLKEFRKIENYRARFIRNLISFKNGRYLLISFNQHIRYFISISV